jgi:probable addiction module antidote protein
MVWDLATLRCPRLVGPQCLTMRAEWPRRLPHVGAILSAANMRSLEISLNAALRTADILPICAVIYTALRKSSDVSSLAKDAGVGRTALYRSFRSKRKGPGLDLTIKILSALGIRFVVEFVRQPKINSRRSGPPRKSDVHLELGSNSRMAAQYLTRAFDTFEIAAIVAAFSDVLRAQGNVVELAGKTVRDRSSLYRAFTPPRIPKLSTVVSFLDALGLRLAVKAFSGANPRVTLKIDLALKTADRVASFAREIKRIGQKEP